MNLLLLHPEQALSEGLWRLSDRQARHVCGVLKLSVGDTLRTGILNGGTGKAKIESIKNNGVEVFFNPDSEAADPLPLNLLLALPRPKMLKRILIDATSLGIKRIVLINSWKVDKSYWQTPELKADLLTEKLQLGLEQAGDTMLPTLTLAKRFKPFVEDELAQLAGDSRCILADPSGENYMPADLAEPVTLAVGPEGGWTDYERRMLLEQGFECFRLGERILRSETALPTITGRLMRLC